MKTAIKDVEYITCGVVRFEESEEGLKFFRFTKEQEEYYKETNDDFYAKTFATSGVRLDFITDARELFFRVCIDKASSRYTFCFDFFINGELKDKLKNFSEEEAFKDGADLKKIYPLGEFEKKIALGEGEKRVTIYFPWSVRVTLKEFELKDATYIRPAKKSKKMLFLGDSITQGYDALSPSNRPAVKVSELFQAEEICKAIGGETFCPEITEGKEPFTPDYIYVAYGTNDWKHLSSKELARSRCREFYKNLRRNYPETPIFTYTPLWRGDAGQATAIGEFSDIEEIVRSSAKEINAICFNGNNLLPHDIKLFSDGYLHPNDEGFKCLAESLIKEFKKIKID